MHRRRTGKILVLLCLVRVTAYAQLVSQGVRLLGSGASGPAAQGSFAALSADGNTLAVAGNADNNSSGAVWVFTRSNGAWSQQGPKLTCPDPQGTEAFGNTLGLSADGNTLIAGHNTASNGAWVFVRSNGAWQFQQKLTAPSGSTNQGAAVAVSGDGNTAILGDPLSNSITVNGRSGSAGGAWVFTRRNGTWTLQQGLVGSGMLSPANQGTAVALSSDGNTAVLGGPSDNNPGGSSEGAIWIFTRSGTGWDQGVKLVGQTNGLNRQGTAVAISADGSTVLDGGFYGTGGAWVFVRSGGSWVQQGATALAGPKADKFSADGSSVALNSGGNVALVGAPGANLVSVFNRSNGIWTYLQQITTSDVSAFYSQFGASAAISSDTTTVAIGAPGDPVQGKNSTGGGWTWYAPAANLSPAAGTAQMAIVGSAFPARLQAEVTNSLGYPAPSVTVTFTAPSSGPGGVFQGATNVVSIATNSAGLAVAPSFTANTVAGPYTVSAEVSGITRTAEFALTNAPPAVNVTLQTTPPNLMVSLDKGKFTAAPLTLALVPGATHTIAAQSPQPGPAGAQYIFSGWSDGLAVTHSITVPAVDTIYTASFITTAPAIAAGGVRNAASNVLPGATGGIAQGSIASIYGTGLGPSTPVSAASLPLANSLAGVTVSLSPGSGPSMPLIPIFVSATQINAIVPSAAPIGPASLAVSYQALPSVPVSVRIVSTSFGIFTGSYGSGAAAAIDANTINPYVSETNPANPGDFILLFGTGLGAVAVPDNQAPGSVSPAGLGVQIMLGGQTIEPTYSGRAPQFPGLDQINFQIPGSRGAVAACAVPLTVRVNGAPSTNTATLNVAGSSACPQ